MAGILTVLAAWLVAAVVAAAALSAVARTLSGARLPLSPRDRRLRRVNASQSLLLATAAGAAILSSDAAQWQPVPLVVVLAALALATDAAPLPLGPYRFTGAFVALVLAMALLGPAPAVAIGLLCAGVDAVRARPGRAAVLNNLAAYATFPLAGGLLLHGLTHPAGLALACAVTAVAVNLLNFVLVAGHWTLVHGASLRRAVREMWVPLLPWEAATAVVASATVYGYFAIGPVVVAGFAVSLAVLQLVAARIAAAAASPDRTAPSM